jgi:hypothetical protein
MSVPTVNVTGPIISKYLTDHPTGALSERLNAYVSGPVFAVNYHLDYTAALETAIDETFLTGGDFATLATEAVSGAIVTADIPGQISSAYTAADIPGQISSAYTAADIPGQISTAVGLYDFTTVASGAVSGAVSGAIAAPDGSLYTYVNDTVFPTFNASGLEPIYDRLRVMTNFMQVVADQSNLKDGFNNPYNWASLMNINPLGFATGAIAFPILQNTNMNYPNGYRFGVIIQSSITPNDTFTISNFMSVIKSVRYDIYTQEGTYLTPSSDYVTNDNVNVYSLASFGGNQSTYFTGLFPVPGTYYIVLRMGNVPALITDPVELSIKFYSNGTSISFTPF